MFIALGQTVSKGNEDAISLRINSQQKSFFMYVFSATETSAYNPSPIKWMVSVSCGIF